MNVFSGSIIASPSPDYRYFHSKPPDELISVAPLAHIFTSKTHYATSTVSKHPHSLCILIIRNSTEMFIFQEPLRSGTISCVCLLEEFKFNLFNSRVNAYLTLFPPVTFISHTVGSIPLPSSSLGFYLANFSKKKKGNCNGQKNTTAIIMKNNLKRKMIELKWLWALIFSVYSNANDLTYLTDPKVRSFSKQIFDSTNDIMKNA